MSDTESEVSSTQVVPSPAAETRSRRRFSAAYKRKIVKEIGGCKRGKIGEVLRREGLYGTQVRNWQREFELGQLHSSKTTPGPAAKRTSEERKIEKLEAEIARLKKKLSLKDDCLDLQKKALEMLEKLDDGSDA